MYLFAAGLGGFPTYLHMTNIEMGTTHVFQHESNKLWQVFKIKHFCQNCMCVLILRMVYFTAFCTVGNGEIFSGKPPKINTKQLQVTPVI